MNKIVWKVVRHRNGELRSGGLNTTDSYSLIYKLGETTFPLGKSKIFCFKTRSAARKWKRCMGGFMRLYKAEAMSVIQAPEFRAPSDGGGIRLFWESNCIRYAYEYMPENTLWCDSLKLIEKVS